MGSGFDDLLADLEGTGKYQNRIAWFLIGPLFFVTPFAFLNQLFVLYIPGNKYYRWVVWGLSRDKCTLALLFIQSEFDSLASVRMHKILGIKLSNVTLVLIILTQASDS